MVKVINKDNYIIHLNEQTVKELMHAIKETNESEEPVGEITVTSTYSQNDFKITLGESESIGFRVTDKLFYAETDNKDTNTCLGEESDK